MKTVYFSRHSTGPNKTVATETRLTHKMEFGNAAAGRLMIQGHKNAAILTIRWSHRSGGAISVYGKRKFSKCKNCVC